MTTHAAPALVAAARSMRPLHAAAGVFLLSAFLWALHRASLRLRELRARAAESERNRTRFHAMADCSVDAIVILSPARNPSGEIEDLVITFLNGRACDLLDLPPEALAGGSLNSLLSPLEARGLLAQYKEILATGQPTVEEFSVHHPSVRASWLRVSALRFEDGLLLTATDLTEQKDFERQLCHLAFHDPLTRLPNRALLDDRIQQAIELAKRNQSAAAILILDIDDFKQINDAHGHAAGDFVLRTVADRLRHAVRASDSVFRLGGDEFVLVFCDVAKADPPSDFARKIVINLLAPIVWKQQRFHISASIGVAMYPAAGTTPETLLVQADIEMYRMKRARSSHRSRQLKSSGRFPKFSAHRH